MEMYKGEVSRVSRVASCDTWRNADPATACDSKCT